MDSMFITPDQPALVLAPMEGVLDAPMRALLAEAGGFNFAVTEFVRVSQQVIRAKAIAGQIPELTDRRFGRAVLPIQVQLLGSEPQLLAETAVEACIAGARAIDLNFGCPSPTVNRRQGGSALLREPQRIRFIVEAVRRALPANIPVSAKVRLGWERTDELTDIAKAVSDGGADWITIHARTRQEQYRPGVHWEPVRKAREILSIPVVANGDLFSVEALKACQRETGCRHFMVGRGVMLNPFIGREMAAAIGLGVEAGLLAAPETALPHSGFLAALPRFIQIARELAPNNGYVPCRIKQWLGMVRAVDAGLLPRGFMTAIGKSRSAQEILDAIGLALEEQPT